MNNDSKPITLTGAVVCEITLAPGVASMGVISRLVRGGHITQAAANKLRKATARHTTRRARVRRRARHDRLGFY